MSNKFLALLILIFTISGIFWVYFYFFVGYTWTVIINSNISDYQVELYTKKLWKTFDYQCQQSPCILNDLSPLSYNLRIYKKGYNSISQNLDIDPRTSVNISINAIKEISFDEILQVKNKVSNKDKISLLRDKKRSYRLFDFEDWSYAYFTESSQWELPLYVYNQWNSQKIGDFSASDSLDVKRARDTNFLYIRIWELRYLYNIQRWVIQVLDLGVDVNYVKSWQSDNSLVFITPVWAYTYNIDTTLLEYFYLFKDFVYFEDDYIGVIYADEEKKLKNLNLEDKKTNLIIKYNPLLKQREILYETAINIDQIYIEDGVVYFESEGRIYSLDNL